MTKPSYSIVIPCHNEQDTIQNTVNELQKVISSISDCHLVLVDNLSTDATWEQLQALDKEFGNLSVHKSDLRKGYGVAIKSGVAASKGTHIVFVMADGSEKPEDVRRFIEISKEHPDACIFGDRFSEPGLISGYPPFKRVLNRLVNAGLRVGFKTGSPDLTNGFKLYPRELIEKIDAQSNDFSITLELSLGAICAGADVMTLPSSWKGRTAGQSSFSVLAMGIPYLRVAAKYLFAPKKSD
jgi:glycosyltransferase involved in cell wall biosynthesis